VTVNDLNRGLPTEISFLQEEPRPRVKHPIAHFRIRHDSGRYSLLVAA